MEMTSMDSFSSKQYKFYFFKYIMLRKDTSKTYYILQNAYLKKVNFVLSIGTVLYHFSVSLWLGKISLAAFQKAG